MLLIGAAASALDEAAVGFGAATGGADAERREDGEQDKSKAWHIGLQYRCDGCYRTGPPPDSANTLTGTPI